MPILILLTLALVAWLFIKWTDLRDRLGEMESRLDRLRGDFERFKGHKDSAPALKPPPLTTRGAQPTRSPLADKPMPFEADIPFSQPTVASTVEQTPLAQPLPRPPEPPPIWVPSTPERLTRTHAVPPSEPSRPTINWESFLGVKLFAWVGGLALFLGMVFFVKYSFERNWITPAMRVAIGYAVGLGIIGGGLKISRKRHPATVQTLCASGVLILYANIFASHTVFRFFGPALAFALMALVTGAAFLLAVWLDAQVVAVLGLLGGFLTPPLLSTGVDRPLALFGYLALLDIGLLAVALRKSWNYLALLAAVSTALMQFGWVLRFFEEQKIYTGLGIFLGFAGLFAGAFGIADRQEKIEKWISAAALLAPGVAFGFAYYLLAYPYPDIAHRPGRLFSFIFLVDAAVLVITSLRKELRPAGFAAGGAVFFLLIQWTLKFLSPELLNAGLGFYLLFALAHSVHPVFLQRLKPSAVTLNVIHLFPALALALILFPLFRIPSDISFLLWPVVLMLDLLAILLAILTASLFAILIVFLLTVIATALWIFQLPPVLTAVSGMLVVIGGFAIIFMAAAVFAGKKVFVLKGLPAREGENSAGAPISPAAPAGFAQMVWVSAVLPFLLLTLVVLRLPLANPAPLFGLAAVLLVLLLGLVRFFRMHLLTITGLFSILVVECAWQAARFNATNPWPTVGWYLGFGLALFAFPFLFLRKFDRVLPWAIASLSLPLHFFLLYEALHSAYPGFRGFGLLPAALALPAVLGLPWLAKRIPASNALRPALLAWVGGSLLFFITLIFPLQLERQWLTVSWALEGAALLALFHRVPHPGLRLVGVGLLVAVFARLALNPWVITSYGRTGQPILNWYLYAYGISAACLLIAGRLLAPPRQRLADLHAPALLYSLSSILSFLLLNIEIADYFSEPGNTLTFNFSANLGQDMTYSLAWGAFAFGLLTVGFRTANRPTRYAGMALLIATLLKLFLHDLWRLGGLYRIGSLIGLAVLLILVSFIYQRFLSSDAPVGK
jgi:hypothetical protein